MATSKKSIATKASAIVLAVVLLFGLGSYSYLTSSTNEIVNDFDENHNNVDIEETTDGYDIVPGTSQDKDPVVTATYTLDSYVFVEVTDDTKGLVTYYIENGWTLLSEDTDENGVTTYIYYQLLEYDEDTADEDGVCTTELHVLKGDKVYYSASITNEDMEYAEDVTLSFQAYIIQADPFADAANAWLALNGDGVVINDSTGIVYTDASTAVATAISEASNGDTIRLLTDNLEVTSTVSVDDSITLDLDGYTLELYGLYLSNDADLIIQNGTINSTDGIAQVSNTSDSDLTLLNLDLNVTSGHAIQAYTGTILVDSTSSVTTTAAGTYCAMFIGSNDSANDGKKLTINIYGKVESKNSYYAISGNGSYDYTSTEINIYDGATVSAPNGMAIYHPQDYGVINIYGGTVTGYNGILVAGGTVNIYGGTIEGTANDTDYRSGASGTYYNGCAICVNAATSGYSNVVVNIIGGTIQSTYCYGLWADAVNNAVYTATINITGGTFSGVASSDTDINQEYSSSTGEYGVSNYGISSGKVIINDNR